MLEVSKIVTLVGVRGGARREHKGTSAVLEMFHLGAGYLGEIY